MEKKKILITLGCVIGLLFVIGISYAYWSLTFTQTENNVVMTDCFEIEFIEGNAINLSKAYPVSDSDGMKNTPYTFTIKNICDSNAKYQINLETLTPNGKKLPDQYLKANLMESNVSKITSKLESSLETEPTIEGAVNAYQLLVGELGPKEEKEFSLRIWMHGEVTADMKDSMNAEYNGKISVITSYQHKDNRGTLMTVASNEAFWNYKENIMMVEFENELRVHEDAEHTFDVSETQDGSVMSYLVKPNFSTVEEVDAFIEELYGITIEELKNQALQEGSTEEEFNIILEKMRDAIRNGTFYTLYIQGDGGVIANSNSESLFEDFDSLNIIENLNFLDTSKVTNMRRMFYNCKKLTNLDLSNFNTSNVTNMESMFYCTSSLLTLDVSSFNTSNVTNMSEMFGSNRMSFNSFEELDLSNFDTSNVIDMSGMFFECTSLVNLDLSSFDTSRVTNMRTMFYGCSSLVNLDLSSFNTSNVTDMESMFYLCEKLQSLDISSFDTSKLTSMEDMFSGCSSLVNLDLSSFNTSNVTNMQTMFRGCNSLINLDVNSFDTSKVTNMYEMFYGCNSFINLDVSGFDISNVKSIGGMFQHCESLENLNLGMFDTSSVEYKGLVFANVPNTTVVKVRSEETKNWVLSQNADLNVVVEA